MQQINTLYILNLHSVIYQKENSWVNHSKAFIEEENGAGQETKEYLRTKKRAKEVKGDVVFKQEMVSQEAKCRREVWDSWEELGPEIRTGRQSRRRGDKRENSTLREKSSLGRIGRSSYNSNVDNQCLLGSVVVHLELH